MHLKRYLGLIQPAEFHIHHPKSTSRNSYQTSKHSKKPCVLNARVHTSLIYKWNLGTGAPGEPPSRMPCPLPSRASWVVSGRFGAPPGRRHPQDVPRRLQDTPKSFQDSPKTPSRRPRTSSKRDKHFLSQKEISRRPKHIKIQYPRDWAYSHGKKKRRVWNQFSWNQQQLEKNNPGLDKRGVINITLPLTITR